MKLILFPFLLFSLQNLLAAPHPATSTSLLTDPEKGLAFRGFGFQLVLEKSAWRPVQKESDSLFSEFEFTSKNSSADKSKQIALRMDELSKSQSNIESYAKKWMRDYPHYGFEVLGTKTFSHSSGQGLVVDLLHRLNNKQVRQVILLKNKKVAVFTCTSPKAQFTEHLVDCNQMIKNFTWL